MDNFVLVRASAGSGKTRALVVRYLSLLFEGHSPSKVLALTFTNKAVAEMKERITKVLYAIAHNDDAYNDYLSDISDQTSLSIEALLAQKERVFGQFIKEQNYILTIDKFFNKILRLFCWYDEIPLDFSIKEKSNSTHFFNYFITRLDYQQLNDLIKISLEQGGQKGIGIEAILKLFFELEDIDYNNLELIDTHQVIRQEIQEEIRQAFERFKKAICSNPIASNSAKKAFDNVERVEDILAKTFIQKPSMGEYSYFKKLATDENETLLRGLKDLLRDYLAQKETLLLAKMSRSYQHFKAIKRHYQKSFNELSFGDVTHSLFRLLCDENNAKKIDTPFLYFRLDGFISHILIDEFQDTSIVQYDILKPIIEEIFSGMSYKGRRTLFFVGDHKQSIYRFRGAKKELIEQVSNHAQISNRELDTNYRSSQSVVDFVNESFIRIYAKGDYTFQKCHSQRVGYVEMTTIRGDKDELQESFRSQLITKVKLFLDEGYPEHSITILSFKNKDLNEVFGWLKEAIKEQMLPPIKIINELSLKLIEYPKVKAMIQLVYYLHFEDALYLENFLSLMGLTKASIHDDFITACKNRQEVMPLLFDIVMHYGLYDDNVIAFLEQCGSYKDRLDFVYHIDELEANVLGNSSQGLRLSTIHKSKGLEFDNVILLDQMGRGANDTGKLLFDYDNKAMKLNRIFVKTKGRESLDDTYKDALDREKSAQTQDLINTLYVAITRAKNNLVILQKEDKSKFELLGLSDKKMGVLEPFDRRGDQKILPLKSQESPSYNLKSYGVQEEFLKKEEEALKSKESLNKQLEDIEFGKAFHYMMECLYFLDKSSLEVAFNLCVNRYGFNLPRESIGQVRDLVAETLEHKHFKSLIADAHTIKKEINFSHNDRVGVIDLLLESDEMMVIVDYKTASSDKQSAYMEQIHFYKEAIGAIYNKKVVGYLFFIREQMLQRC